MSERVTILGAGSWGMAVSHLLAENGHEVILWEHDPADLKKLRADRSNPDRLNGFRLSETVNVTGDLQASLVGAALVLLVVPSQFVRGVLIKASQFLSPDQAIVSLAKGIETSSLKRMTEVISELTNHKPDALAVLSGPSHAEEVVQDIPTTVVTASDSDELAGRIQRLLSTSTFRVYQSDDVTGVELGGALKNIIAIAAGIADGLGMGDNSKGALLTRGMAEITRLGVACGARADTFAGLSGFGDLMTTCFSRHSRNRQVGEQISKGKTLEEILAGMTMVAEGVETTRSALKLAEKSGVEMPITAEVHAVLFEGKNLAEAVNDLMGRKLRAEIWR